jgi:hypothetical protein
MCAGQSAIVVEDLVSGIAIIKAMEHYVVTVLVNYGTKINIEAVYALRSYKDVTMWLDNDSTHVKDQAKLYAKTIALYSGKKVRIIKERGDPKHFALRDIALTILEAWGG